MCNSLLWLISSEKEDVFDNIQTVIARFLDIDHVLSMCVQIPKQETLKTAEANINNIIFLKHILELVDPLRNALSNCENRLMKHYYKVHSILVFILHVEIHSFWREV